MKILSIRSHRPLSSFLIVLAFLCVHCCKTAAQDFKTVHDGVEYAEVTREISGLKVNMNLLRLDLTKVRLDVHHAMDAAIGTEKTSSIATRHGAVAAINAGFFRLDTSVFAGDDVGVLKIDGILLSESDQSHPVVILRNNPNKTSVVITRLMQQHILEIGGKVFPTGTNRQRKENEIIEYTPAFGRSTLTNPGGLEIVVRGGRISEIDVSTGSSPIPAEGYIISASGSKTESIKQVAKIGQAVKKSYWTVLDNALSGPAVKAGEDIISGRGYLLSGSKIVLDVRESSKSFVETRHPRTAVAKLKDGKFLMITVDGRSESSGGIGLYDLANYLLELGAVDAMNLDGGGSTTMFLDGKVVNYPSDKEGERKVSDAILVTLRKKK
jgi:exopolysaccharide biosynthesis protein